MTWKQGTLYAMVETGDEDELGNPVKIQELLWVGQLRFTPWSDEDISINGREVTMNEQRFAVPVPYGSIKEAEQAELDGDVLHVTSISDLGPRWTTVQVKVHKQ